MRTMIREQQPLMQPFIDHEHALELATMSDVLDRCAGALEQIEGDLAAGKSADIGRPGMSSDLVVRALVVKQMNGFSYEELAFHLADSTCYRAFCRIGAFEEAPSRSTLQENIKRLSAESLEELNRALLECAMEDEFEDGSTVRGDCTTVESNIHHPTDSSLLWDTVRVLTRLLRKARRFGVRFTDHKLRAKRRWYDIHNARRKAERIPPYRDLMNVTTETVEAAERAVLALPKDDEKVRALSDQLGTFAARGRCALDQTRRRVIEDESVPSSEKIVSIFEDHTDIIMKGGREPGYGHKVCLTTGPSSMILDCQVLEGNPADQTLATKMMERHCDIFGEAPRQAAFDGGFASRPNLYALKEMGVEDVAFSKRCGLAVSDMVSSSWVYKRLRDFRAGIEGCISFLKRCFGLARCLWRSFASFQAYVWASIVSVNLLIFARCQITRE